MKRILFTGIAYVTAVFAAGFILGVLRTLILIPLLGELTAVLIELPVKLRLPGWSAHASWGVGRYCPRLRWGWVPSPSCC